MSSLFTKNVTIFEGCDGSGKTTVAQTYAESTDAKYVHFPALPQVTRGLARMYVEAMLPALLGYQDVVLDRCWLSETPYGEAFREGQDRLTQACRRMLERLAYRCGAVAVLCQPKWDVVKENYRKRKALEMLKNETQLRQVYDLYRTQGTALPLVPFDYETHPMEMLRQQIQQARNPNHLLSRASAGNWDGGVVLVGESFAERKDQDPWYQWPFASFSGEGCSRWLTEQLDKDGIPEENLLWVNSDQDLSFLHDLEWSPVVVALGDKAMETLYKEKIEAKVVKHPQYWKRFRSGELYPLLEILGDLYE
jgi:thymidylate kinase